MPPQLQPVAVRINSSAVVVVRSTLTDEVRDLVSEFRVRGSHLAPVACLGSFVAVHVIVSRNSKRQNQTTSNLGGLGSWA